MEPYHRMQFKVVLNPFLCEVGWQTFISSEDAVLNTDDGTGKERMESQYEKERKKERKVKIKRDVYKRKKERKKERKFERERERKRERIG